MFPRVSALGGLLSPTYEYIKPKEHKDACRMQVSEVIALQVLGVMISHKEAERMSIINQLISMGFQVNL